MRGGLLRVLLLAHKGGRMTSRCIRCDRYWGHACGTIDRFLYITVICPDCITHPDLGERVL